MVEYSFVLPLLCILLHCASGQSNSLTNALIDPAVVISPFSFDIAVCNAQRSDYAYSPTLFVSGEGKFAVFYFYTYGTFYNQTITVTQNITGNLTIACSPSNDQEYNYIALGDFMNDLVHIYSHKLGVITYGFNISSSISTTTFGASLQWWEHDVSYSMKSGLYVGDPANNIVYSYDDMSYDATSPFSIVTNITNGSNNDRFGASLAFTRSFTASNAKADLIATAPGSNSAGGSVTVAATFNVTGAIQVNGSPNERWGKLFLYLPASSGVECVTVNADANNINLYSFPVADPTCAASSCGNFSMPGTSFGPLANINKPGGPDLLFTRVYAGTAKKRATGPLHQLWSLSGSRSDLATFFNPTSASSILNFTSTPRKILTANLQLDSWDDIFVAYDNQVVLYLVNPPGSSPSASASPVSPSQSPSPTPSISPSTSTTATPSVGPSLSASPMPSGSTESNNTDMTGAIAGATAGGGTCLVIVVGVVFWWRRKKNRDLDTSTDSEEELEPTTN